MESSWRDYVSKGSRIGRKSAGERGGPQSIHRQRDKTAQVRAEKSAEAAMRQFAARERQAEKEKMRGLKDKVMQEIARELHIIRQTHEEMEAQRQSFQFELERICGKLEQLEFRSKTLENEVRALRSSGQLAARNPPPIAQAVAVSSSGNQNTRAERETEDRRSEERSQEHQQARTQVTKASTPK